MNIPKNAVSTELDSPDEPDLVFWVVGIAICSILGWVVYNFLPEWDLPERLREVTGFSSKELQQELDVAKMEKRFWDSATKFGLLGACYGLVSVFLIAKRPAMVLVCIAIGLFTGACAGIIGYSFFGYIERGGSIVGVDDGLLPMVMDVILLTVASWSLVVPTGMTLWLARPKSKTMDPSHFFIAGILAGVVVPIGLSIAFPNLRSDAFPLKGRGLILVWLSVVAILLAALPYLPKRKIKSEVNG